MLMCAGTALAIEGTSVGLFIQNDMDSNGNISVINGTKVKVGWEVLSNADKLLGKSDKIQLVRVLDDTVISSVTRGKGSSGTVSLKVKNSANEKLYVRYQVKKDGSFPAVIPDVSDPDHIPLVSIPGANLADLSIRVSALEAAPPPLYIKAAIYREVFAFGKAPSEAQCANWKAFRANLKPANYSCVQIVGSNGLGKTSCNATQVAAIASALRSGTSASETIEGSEWNITNGGSSGIFLGVDGNSGTCLAKIALRPCINSQDWGGLGGTDEGPSCAEPSQSISLNFQ